MTHPSPQRCQQAVVAACSAVLQHWLFSGFAVDAKKKSQFDRKKLLLLVCTVHTHDPTAVWEL